MLTGVTSCTVYTHPLVFSGVFTGTYDDWGNKLYSVHPLVLSGVFSGTYDDWGNKLYTLWFDMYTRSGKLSSSGFEHVFIGEMALKNVAFGCYSEN